MANPKIVVIDDDLLMLEMCRDILEINDFDCLTVSDSSQAAGVIQREKPDLVITDLQMPTVSGMEVLRSTKEFDPCMPVIILTGHGSIESAVEAVQAGASDYVPKPFKPDELCHRINQSLETRRLTEENQDLRRQLARTKSTTEIVGSSKAMEHVFATIERAAPTNASVMIIGESGTGKEMVARSIHGLSNHADNPFVPVDCGSLPSNLIESELFGHMKGSFTGAIDDKPGIFETANGGTLFLDEITEMSSDLQSKLLRVLQERKFRRVGGRELLDLNVRLIAATNRNPQQAIDEGVFRLDLYYRLNVIPVELPPLRERQDDVVHLLNHFLASFSEANGRDVRSITRAALDALLAYAWPGNVRELQNLTERLVIMSQSETITLDDLPPNITGLETVATPQTFTAPASGASGNGGFDEMLLELPFKNAKQRIVKQFQRDYLEELLRRHDGNVSAAARVAQIDRKTIHRLARQLGIQVHEIRHAR